jgi:hypothetical protein
VQAHLYANLSSLALSESLAGSAFVWPKLVAGADLTLRLRLARRLEGESVETQRTVVSVAASVGRLDARPESGTFQLKVGGGAEAPGVNVTTDLAYNITGVALQTAINALSGVPDCTVVEDAGSYRIRFADGASREIVAVDNALWPLSGVNVMTSEHDEGTLHTLRLTQVPAASSVTYREVLATVPTVEQIQEGGSEGDVEWNDLQKLLLPADFNAGSFQLRRGFKRTPAIGLPTSGEEVAAALKEIADDGGEFVVTEQQNALLIEFAGDMGGRSQDLLEVVVIEGPLPDLEITVPTETAAMDVLMRRVVNGELALPLEIRLVLQDEQDEEVEHTYLFRSSITFLPVVNTAGRDVSANVDFLQPLTRRSYRPFGNNQFLVGQRHARFVIGDGVATSFQLPHNLATSDILLNVWENAADGQLVAASAYVVERESDNSVLITPATVLATAAWAVLITSAAHPATFVAHTHTIEDVTGLDAQLAALFAAVNELQAIAPSGGLSVDTAAEAAVVAEWALAPLAEVYPSRHSFAAAGEVPGTVADITLAQLLALNIRDGGLLPAVHAATVSAIVDPATLEGEEDWAGTVYWNNTAEDVNLPGGKGRRRDTLRPGEYAAHNGFAWYKVAQDGTSYFPTQFNRQLFEMAVNDRQLRFKKVFRLDFGFEAGLLTRRAAELEKLTNSPRQTQAQWCLLVEWGEYVQEEGEGKAMNLQTINWRSDKPIIEQRIVLTGTPTVHTFGVEILRSASGVLSCNRILYGAKEGAPLYASDVWEGETEPACPPTANFALRARLARFDTQNDVWEPEGLVALVGLARKVGSGSGNIGKATIS